MLTCPQCQTSNAATAKFCEACGASLEQVAASARMADTAEAEVMLLEVKKAQGALAVVAGLQLLGAVFMFVSKSVDGTTFAVMLGIAAVFAGLWAWAKSNPLAASIAGLVVFVTVHGADAVVDPKALLNGIVVKVIVVVVLGRAIGAGIKHREFTRSRGLA